MALTLVPEYCWQWIEWHVANHSDTDGMVLRGGTRVPARPYWTEHAPSYYVNDDGVIYMNRCFDEDGLRFGPSSIERTCITPIPGHRFEDAPFLTCACGNDRLHAFYPGDYRTDVRCPECGWQETVHEG